MTESGFFSVLISSVLLFGAVSLGTASCRADVVTDFSSKYSGDLRWRIVDDRVMGGRSQGRFAVTAEETLLFQGNLSLENNGGFSSVRSAEGLYDFSASQGIVLRVRGDGRTYQLRLNTTARFRSWDVSFSASFKTEKDEWIDVWVPFDQFKAGFRGMALPNVTFDPSSVRRFGILLGDKNPGAFRLEIDSIRTYVTKGES